MKQDNGFTLLEMLISLSLMAMMAVLLANALDFGRQSWERSNRLEPIQSQALSRSDLRIWLQEYDRKNTFSGDQTGFSFEHWPHVRPFQDAVKYTTKLSKTRDDGAEHLTLTTQGYNLDGKRVYSNTRLLSADLNSIQIRYFGRANATSQSKWHKSWEFPTGHLRLLKIEGMRQSGKPMLPFTVRVGWLRDHSTIDLTEPRPKDLK